MVLNRRALPRSGGCSTSRRGFAIGEGRASVGRGCCRLHRRSPVRRLRAHRWRTAGCRCRHTPGRMSSATRSAFRRTTAAGSAPVERRSVGHGRSIRADDLPALPLPDPCSARQPAPLWGQHQAATSCRRTGPTWLSISASTIGLRAAGRSSSGRPATVGRDSSHGSRRRRRSTVGAPAGSIAQRKRRSGGTARVLYKQPGSLGDAF